MKRLQQSRNAPLAVTSLNLYAPVVVTANLPVYRRTEEGKMVIGDRIGADIYPARMRLGLGRFDHSTEFVKSLSLLLEQNAIRIKRNHESHASPASALRGGIKNCVKAFGTEEFLILLRR